MPWPGPRRKRKLLNMCTMAVLACKPLLLGTQHSQSAGRQAVWTNPQARSYDMKRMEQARADGI